MSFWTVCSKMLDNLSGVCFTCSNWLCCEICDSISVELCWLNFGAICKNVRPLRDTFHTWGFSSKPNCVLAWNFNTLESYPIYQFYHINLTVLSVLTQRLADIAYLSFSEIYKKKNTESVELVRHQTRLICNGTSCIARLRMKYMSLPKEEHITVSDWS